MQRKCCAVAAPARRNETGSGLWHLFAKKPQRTMLPIGNSESFAGLVIAVSTGVAVTKNSRSALLH